MIKSCQKLQKDNEDRMLVFVVKWNLDTDWFLIMDNDTDNGHNGNGQQDESAFLCG